MVVSKQWWILTVMLLFCSVTDVLLLICYSSLVYHIRDYKYCSVGAEETVLFCFFFLLCFMSWTHDFACFNIHIFAKLCRSFDLSPCVIFQQRLVEIIFFTPPSWRLNLFCESEWWVHQNTSSSFFFLFSFKNVIESFIFCAIDMSTHEWTKCKTLHNAQEWEERKDISCITHKLGRRACVVALRIEKRSWWMNPSTTRTQICRYLFRKKD